MNTKTKNLGEVEDRFSAVLQKCNIDGFISVETVKKWIVEDTGNQSDVLGLIGGLLDVKTLQQEDLINELMNATIELIHHVPLDRLDGETFKEVLETRKEKGEKTKVNVSKTRFPQNQWRQYYHEAIECMHNQNLKRSCEKYDETFDKLLNLQTTDREIYRVYCNAGLAYLFSGKESLGVSCLKMACDLNPKYSFAYEQIDSYSEGDFDPYIKLGFMTEMKENIDEFVNDPSWFILDEVMDWSEEKILDKLASFDVKVDKEEFIKQAKLAHNPEDVAEAIFYPQTQITGPKDDFVWMAANALWDLYCPDEPNIIDFNDLVYNASMFFSTGMGRRSERFVRRSKLSFFKDLKTYVYADKNGFLERWKKTYEGNVDQTFDLSNILIKISSLKLLGKEVLEMINHLKKQIPHPDWETVEIICKIRNNDSSWKKQYTKTKNSNPYYCYVACGIASHYIEEEEYETAEIYADDALKIVDKRAEKRKFSLETSVSSIYDDYDYVCDILDMIYDLTEPDLAKIKKLESKMDEVESNYELFSKEPTMDELNEKLMDMLDKTENKLLDSSSAVKYYKYLNKKDINFETNDEVHVDQTPLIIKPEAYNLDFDSGEKDLSKAKNVKKPGRNDLCYCGSGKKYKKCCGSLI